MYHLYFSKLNMKHYWIFAQKCIWKFHENIWIFSVDGTSRTLDNRLNFDKIFWENIDSISVYMTLNLFLNFEAENESFCFFLPKIHLHLKCLIWKFDTKAGLLPNKFKTLYLIFTLKAC